MTAVSLALGAGGARGVAHIFVLEALDELGVKIDAIAGCSIGAVVGAMYASGMRGRDIRLHLAATAPRRRAVAARLFAGRCVQLTTFSRFAPPERGVLEPLRLVEAFVPDGFPTRFEQLRRGFHALATDLYRDEGVIFSSGDLRLAVAASLAIPGLMHPVRRDGAVLVDGGLLDPIPVRALDPSRAPIIAVDLGIEPETDKRRSPVAIAMAASRVMGRHIGRRLLAEHPPALTLRPGLPQFGSFQFHRVGAMLEGFLPFKTQAKRAIEAALTRAAAA